MRRLFPEPSTVDDPYDVFGWDGGVRLAMVAGVDGSAADEQGWTSGLGGRADLAVLQAMRARSDAILVGAGSIRTGRYPPHRPGRYPVPAAPIVVVTRSAELDWSARVFTEAGTPTVLLAPHPLHAPVEVIVGDLESGLEQLRNRYGTRVLCEGGPTLAGALLDRDLVDELCLTVAPVLVPGPTMRLVEGLTRRRALRLDGVLEADGELFLRYGISSSSRSRPAKSGESTSAT